MSVDPAGQRHLIEVKACSLIEYETAMFPDAPSGRALKHLEELAALARTGYCCHIVFVIVHSAPRVFVPELHTDPRFAAELSRQGAAVRPAEHIPKGKVGIHAALIRCDSEGNALLAEPYIPVDLGHQQLAEADGGNYLILLEVPESQTIAVGALGNIGFNSGWYVYTGSAQKHLSRRMARHLRTSKTRHWHIDYLAGAAKTRKALPIRSYRNLECELAGSLGALGGQGIPGFGCSDCRCGSHLFYFAAPPLENKAFVDMLLWYRHIESLRR